MSENEPYHWLVTSEFAKIPVVEKWLNSCMARGLSIRTTRGYHSCLRYMFRMIEEDPTKVVGSKDFAIKFGQRFLVEFRRKFPQKGTHAYRVTFRNFLADNEIVFAPRQADVIGLSSAHDNYGAHAGVSFTPLVTKLIGDLMLKDENFRTYLWFRIALRTAARHAAISKMSWDRIYFGDGTLNGSECFKLEQHETKDPRGQWYLGQNGEWKTKYLGSEIKNLLLKFKEESNYKQFLWFADSGSDMQNARNARRVAAEVLEDYKYYYQQIEHLLDAHTKEYMKKRPSHILRHTCAQQLKEAGLSDEQISEFIGWRSPQIVRDCYSKTSERIKMELGDKASKIEF